MGCFGTPGDTNGDTPGAIGDVRPSFIPSLSGSGDNFDGLCIEERGKEEERERERKLEQSYGLALFSRISKGQ